MIPTRGWDPLRFVLGERIHGEVGGSKMYIFRIWRSEEEKTRLREFSGEKRKRENGKMGEKRIVPKKKRERERRRKMGEKKAKI